MVSGEQNHLRDEKDLQGQLERGDLFLEPLVQLLRHVELAANCGDLALKEQFGQHQAFSGFFGSRANKLRIKISWPESEEVFLQLSEDTNYDVHLHTPPDPAGKVIDTLTMPKGTKLTDFELNQLWLRLAFKEDEDLAVLVAKSKEKPIDGTRQSTVDVYRLMPLVHKLGLVSCQPSITAEIIPGSEKYNYEQLTGE